METVIAFLSLAFFLAFFVGLVKPSLVRMPSRKKSSLVYFSGSIIFSAIGSSLYPIEEPAAVAKETKAPAVQQQPRIPSFEYAYLNLGDYRHKPKVTRHEIVQNFNESKEIQSSYNEGMYGCLSEFSYTKSSELKLGDVLGWCLSIYERAPDDLSKKINFDEFQANFSAWDGSYRPLERLIKQSMNDDSSYDHVSTVYSLVLNKDPHAIVKTIFKGKNGFGAIMKNSVAARVNIQTGAIEKILEQQ